jgi:PadR family transcriptional regulator AphA
MKKENKTRFVILGMLLDQPRSGYEIREIVRKSINYFWHESDASIYPMLRLLANEKKVLFQTEFVGKRKKEIFTITDAGRQEFVEWLQRPAEPDSRRHEFLLKFYFTTENDKKSMYQHFEHRLRYLEQTLEEYKQIEKRLESLLIEKFPRKHFWIKTLRNGIAHVELDISWIKEQKN